MKGRTDMNATKKYMPSKRKIQTVNQTTGEYTETSYSEINLRDFGYHKMWLSNIYDFVCKTGSKQSQIMFYLMISMNKENIVEETQAEIAEATGSTVKTVRECLKALSEPIGSIAPFIVRIDTSKYRVNPDMIYIGACDKRSKVQIDFYRELAEYVAKKRTQEEKAC